MSFGRKPNGQFWENTGPPVYLRRHLNGFRLDKIRLAILNKENNYYYKSVKKKT